MAVFTISLLVKKHSAPKQFPVVLVAHRTLQYVKVTVCVCLFPVLRIAHTTSIDFRTWEEAAFYPTYPVVFAAVLAEMEL